MKTTTMTAEERVRYMTQAPVRRLILEMSAPTVISMLVTSFYNMADGVASVGGGRRAAGIVFDPGRLYPAKFFRAIPHNSKCRYGERGAADAVPQLPERCLSRKAGIVRCCLRNPHKMQKQSCQKLCFFRIHAKWYFIPVGRDALIPPQRNLADYDKRCK